MVHPPELPIAGHDSAKLGFGLWRQLPLAWCVEALLLAIGLGVYLKATRLSRGRRATLIVIVVFTLVMTIAGQASTTPPPKSTIMAAFSLITIALLVAIGSWLDRGQHIS